jgi:flagellar basal-body rod modification protein FlgD
VAFLTWHNNCFVLSGAFYSFAFSPFMKGCTIMSSISEIASASKIQMDYMELLIVQLQNQNPLEPLDNNEMATQLAQLSQLQQLESMNESFAEVLASTELSYANSLLGKEVTFIPKTETGSTDVTSGVVGHIYNNVDGEIVLGIGNHTIGLEDIISVKNP